MRESRKEVPVGPISPGLGLALAISFVATLYLGILPNRVLQVAQHSAQDLVQAASGAAGVAKSPRLTGSTN
jgi:hypothetical protein